jgi:hypothetical protein
VGRFRNIIGLRIIGGGGSITNRRRFVVRWKKYREIVDFRA